MLSVYLVRASEQNIIQSCIHYTIEHVRYQEPCLLYIHVHDMYIHVVTLIIQAYCNIHMNLIAL